MSHVEARGLRAPAGVPAVACFRRLTEAVDRGARQAIAAQRELRRLGWTCLAVATRHAPPDRGRSGLRG